MMPLMVAVACGDEHVTDHYGICHRHLPKILRQASVPSSGEQCGGLLMDLLLAHSFPAVPIY